MKKGNGGLRAAFFIGAEIMNSIKEKIPDPKNRGEWAELRFMARAAEEGFRVTKPWGESARYDFAVEENGRFLRIQVKSTVYQSRGGYMCGIQPMGRNSASRRYTSDQVDFFAAYIIPEDLWYILPAEIADHLVDKFKVSPNNKHHKYERYKEAWHLLHEAIESKSPLVLPAPPEDEARFPEPAADPDAEPCQLAELRGEIEPAPSVGFDHNLLRRRLTGCFDRILKRQ